MIALESAANVFNGSEPRESHAISPPTSTLFIQRGKHCMNGGEPAGSGSKGTVLATVTASLGSGVLVGRT